MDTALVFGLGLIGNIASDAISKIGYKVIGVDIHEKNFSNEDDENLINTNVCNATNEKETKKL